MTIANWLVIFRILLIPFLIGILILFKDSPSRFWPAVFFAGLALTDWFDGWLARKTRTVTDFGKLFDPLSDKLLVVSILIVLLSFGEINFWPVLIIVFRELLVEGLRALEIKRGRIVAASFWGKAKTVFQMLAVFWLILKWPLAQGFLWLAVILTVVSGLDYFFKVLWLKN